MSDGGTKVASVLVRHNVAQLFTLCGGHISPILSGCKKQGIKVIDVRDEASAVFAADAVSRITGIPGVAAVTAGPGVTNTLTAVKNAQLAQSPLILLGGASATVLRGRGSLQDINQMELIRPHVKYAVTIGKVKDIEPALEKAFEIATSGVPGPVFVELPIDILYPESIVREWYGIKGADQAGGSIGKKAIQFYLDYHTKAMFKDADNEPAGDSILNSVSKTVGNLTHGAQTSLKRISFSKVVGRLLNNAKKPVMLVGSQSTLAPERINELTTAIEQLGVPVYLSGMARGLLGPKHRLQLRHQRKKALREADLVILAGVPNDFRLDYGNHISSRAKLVSINRCKEDLTRNRRPTVAINDDPGSFIEVLAADVAYDSYKKYLPWLTKLRQHDDERNKEIDVQAAVRGAGINPLKLFQKLDTLLPDNSVLVADGGDFVATAAYTLNPRGPLRWLDPGVFGTLGVGGGFAAGGALSHPGSEVWLIYGDGSCAYSLAEFDTFVRHGIGVIALVGNDASWNQIARDQVEILKDDVGTVLRQTDYHTVAKGYGGEGLLLRDPAKIVSTIKKAQEIARTGKPVLINVILQKSDFRKGSISV